MAKIRLRKRIHILSKTTDAKIIFLMIHISTGCEYRKNRTWTYRNLIRNKKMLYSSKTLKMGFFKGDQSRINSMGWFFAAFFFLKIMVVYLLWIFSDIKWYRQKKKLLVPKRAPRHSICGELIKSSKEIRNLWYFFRWPHVPLRLYKSCASLF